MCELFGYSSDGDQALAPWLIPFRARGGANGDNPDGWGIASWHDDGMRLEKSPEPGHASERFLQLAGELRTRLAIAHVRKARIPPVPGMLNTHPFAHHCCEREWVFAHNGLVPEVIAWGGAGPLCRPDGETDSEHAFCHLLSAIADSYDSHNDEWIERLAQLAARIAAHGKFNFLLSDGRLLIAYGHDRLHRLETADGRRAVIATEPLTADAWQPFAPGELRVYRNGGLLARLAANGRALGEPAAVARPRPALG